MKDRLWLIVYVSLSFVVALAWTLALVRDIVFASWLMFLSGPQAFLMWLVVIDGMGVLLKLKKKSGFDKDE